MIPQEDLLFIVGKAIKAPSGHNTQPWLFKINDASIEVHPDFEKSLSVVDPDNRELFISLGCAIENLQIAASAKGYYSDIGYSQSGITVVSLSPEEELHHSQTLDSQIALRQTNRRIYNGTFVDDSAINKLCHIPSEKNAQLHCYKKGTLEFTGISELILSGNTIQMQNNSFLTELKSWMRYNKSESARKRDGLSYAVFGAPSLPRWISKSIINGYLNDKIQNKADLKKIFSSSHFVLFTTQNNTIEDWIRLGRYLQRFLLTCTEMDIACAFLNPPCELEELREDLATSLHIQNEYPAIILRLGYAQPLPYSLRKEVKEVMKP